MQTLYYCWSTSYATYVQHMWTPMTLWSLAHACLHCKVPRQRFIPSWPQGRLQLSGGEHPQQRQPSQVQSTLTTRLRRRHGCPSIAKMTVCYCLSWALVWLSNPIHDEQIHPHQSQIKWLFKWVSALPCAFDLWQASIRRASCSSQRTAPRRQSLFHHADQSPTHQVAEMVWLPCTRFSLIPSFY